MLTSVHFIIVSLHYANVITLYYVSLYYANVNILHYDVMLG